MEDRETTAERRHQWRGWDAVDGNAFGKARASRVKVKKETE